MRRDTRAELLLSAIVHDNILFVEVMNRVDKEVFVENDYNNFLIELRQYYEQFRKAPSYNDFKAFSKSQYEFLADVFVEDPRVERQLARAKIYQNFQSQQTLLLMNQFAEKMNLGALDLKESYLDMRKMVLQTAVPDEDYIALQKDNVRMHYYQSRDFRVTNTSPLIFKNISKIGGGIAYGETLIFIAPPNRGKTIYLINEMWNGMTQGENTLYLSMENEAPSIMSRLFDRILLMPKPAQRRENDFCTTWIDTVWKYITPPVILYRPANTFSVVDLDLWLEEYEQRHGIIFDRIIIDYLNKFKKRRARKTAESWDDDRILTDEIRALGIVRKKRIISAAQTGRQGIMREGAIVESINETMLQGGFGAYETADIVLGYSETPAEKQRGVGRVGVLKYREAGGRGREFVVNMAPWIGLLTDHVEEIIPVSKQAILENPDKEFGQLSGLHAKDAKEKGKKASSGGAPKVADVKPGEAANVHIEGVSI